MKEIILMPKYAKNKKPIKKRKPSKPLDGINHRLLREQAAQDTIQSVPEPLHDDAPPTRAELEAKATQLALKFDGRTSDKKLAHIITKKLGE